MRVIYRHGKECGVNEASQVLKQSNIWDGVSSARLPCGKCPIFIDAGVLDGEVEFFGEDAVRAAKQVVPLNQLRQSAQSDRQEQPTSEERTREVPFLRAELRKVQVKAIARALLRIVPAAAILIGIVFEIGACAVTLKDGGGLLAPSDLFATSWVIGGYLLVTSLLCFTLLYLWVEGNSKRVGYGEVLAIIHRDQRTDMCLSKGIYFLPESAGLRWHKCICDWEVESSVIVSLPPPDYSKIGVKYFLRWRLAHVWEYVESGKNRLISDRINRAVQERLKKHFAIPYEGPQNLSEALGSYDEVRELIQDTVSSLGPLGISVVECRVLDIESVAAVEPSEGAALL